MSSNNFFEPSYGLPEPLAELNEGLHNSGATTLTTTRDPSLSDYNEPLDDVDSAGFGAMLDAFYRTPTPMPTATLGLDQQLPTVAGQPIDAATPALGDELQEGHLAASPMVIEAETGAEVETEAEAEPVVPKKGKCIPRKGVSRKAIGKKSTWACQRCRARRQRCDGKRPCDRCSATRHLKGPCSYVAGARQVGRNFVGPANQAPYNVGQDEPAVNSSHPMAPFRRIAPRPEAPAVAFEGLAAGSEAGLLYSQVDEGFGEFAAGSEVGASPRVLDAGYGRLGTGADAGHLYQEDFGWGLGASNAWAGGVLPHYQQPNPALGGRASHLDRSFPRYYQPGFPVQRFVASPSGTSLPSRRPSMASEATTNWSQMTVTNGWDPLIGYTFDNLP